MTMTHCPHCGGSLVPEANRPDGCCCNALDWGDPLNIPAVCDNFSGSLGQNCKICEHDYACHAEAKK